MQPRIKLLMTGNELMSGITVDSNSSMIAQKIELLGLSIAEKVTIGDDVDLLQREILRLAESADLLIINGGLGPTLDDLTAECLAAVAGVAVTENQESLTHLKYWCEHRGVALNQANLKQAMLPEGVTVIPNPVGSAVGFRLRLGRCDVVCTPGVPGELRSMMDEQISPWLEQRFPERHRVQITRLQLFGIGESALQQLLSDSSLTFPTEVELGFRAGAPTLELKLTIRSEDHQALCQQVESQIRQLLGEYIIGTGNETLQERVVATLRERARRLTVAESCTGGLLAAMVTSVPGSSEVFEAGFVTYSNEIKHSVLGVEESLLLEQGAVSQAVVCEMASGALRRSGADYVIAVSGIAGPDGGSEGKPVGTVWIAWGEKGDIKSRQLYFPFTRTLFQTMVAATGLDLIRRLVLGIEQVPRYLDERVLPGKRNSQRSP